MFPMVSNTYTKKMFSGGIVDGHYHIRVESEFNCNLQLLLILFEAFNTVTSCCYASPV